MNGNAQTIPESSPDSRRAVTHHRLRTAAAGLVVAALCGCALLRSAPRLVEEWLFVDFPGSGTLARDRLLALAATNQVAVTCAAPNVVTFVVELGCGALDYVPARRARQLLIVGNSSPRGYRPDVLRAVMAQREAAERFAAQAATLATAGGYGGMLLDFRSLGARDVNSLVGLVAAVSDAARARNLPTVGIVIPVADTAAYPGRHLGALTDFLALQLELEPSSPGPFTPRDRIARLVGARAAEIGAHRLMLLIPAGGYLWREGDPRVPVSFEDAAAAAREWGVDFVRDESSATLRARAPGRGEVWVSDAVLIAGIVRDARRLGIRKFALYGLGGEDPAIWPAIRAEPEITR